MANRASIKRINVNSLSIDSAERSGQINYGRSQGNSLEFALRETAKGVSWSGKAINLYGLYCKLQIFLAQGLQTQSEKFSSRSMEMPVFFKTSANTTPQQSFLLEGLNRFSLDK